jgi:uncharacterized protein YtpQ (UPF0354 family)
MTSDRSFCERAVAYLKAPAKAANVDVVLSRPNSPVITDLGNGLLVSYIVDHGNHFEYVLERHLADCDLSQSELHQRAINNLLELARTTHIDIRPHCNIFAVIFGGNFEASLILLDGLWEHYLNHLAPNGFVVAIPCRDILAFCDAKSETGIDELHQLIARVKDGDHPISPVLYRRYGSSWHSLGN